MPAEQTLGGQRVHAVLDGAEVVADVHGVCLRTQREFFLYVFDVEGMPIDGEVRDNVFGDDFGFKVLGTDEGEQPRQPAFFKAGLAQGIKNAPVFEAEVGPVRELVDEQHTDNINYSTQKNA